MGNGKTIEFKGLLHLMPSGKMRLTTNPVEVPARTLTRELVLNVPKRAFEKRTSRITINLQDATQADDEVLVGTIRAALSDLPVTVDLRAPGSDLLVIEGITTPADFTLGVSADTETDT